MKPFAGGFTVFVDDTEDNIFFMTASLENGYELLQASSGREALAIIVSRVYQSQFNGSQQAEI